MSRSSVDRGFPKDDMGILPKRHDLQRIVVLNPKGGCGKTSIATNLASHYSLLGAMPTLLDCDRQGASMRWLEKRSRLRPPIHGIAAFRNSLSVTRSWQQRVPHETRQVIVDTPAGLDMPQIHDLIYDASNLIIPVLPSPIDIRFAARFIAELMMVAQLDRRAVRVGIVANRTRRNTKSLQQLMRFLSSLKIPLVAVLRDSQNYVNAVGRGIGIAEMPDYLGRHDLRSLSPLFTWLDQWRPPIGLNVHAVAADDANDSSVLPVH